MSFVKMKPLSELWKEASYYHIVLEQAGNSAVFVYVYLLGRRDLR